MARGRRQSVMWPVPPFQRAFPVLSLWVAAIGGLVKAAGVLARLLWPYRREIGAAIVLYGLWRLVGGVVPGVWAVVVVVLVTVAALSVRRVRRAVAGWLACGRTRRRLLRGFAQTRTATVDGRLPLVVKTRSTPIGERLWLRLRPGQSWELLDLKTEEFRAAVRCRDVRLTRDENRSNRVTVDVVRRDTLSSGLVAWADRDKETLSIWDPVHWGRSELGEVVRLSLVERAVLIGGNRGAGKSSGINVLVAHAAKSPDVELLLIDANKVQLSPWRDRALAFADHDPDDAIDVVRMWRDEMDRRLTLLTSLPGIPLALTREISTVHNLPVWLLIIDELAYHMSVAGTRAQQTEFYATLRDGVARGRAAGMGAVVATQRPTHDLIPTSLRDLFDIRIAYRTMTRTSSDVILGDDFAKQGYSARDIDITARGVCWLFAEGRTPVRTKSAWISSQTRAELSVTTVRFRPSTTRPVPLPRNDSEENR